MSITGVALGWGATIRIGRGSPVAWTALIGAGDFDFPQGEADEVEVTSHSSTNRTKEFIPGFIDNGQMTVPVDWLPGTDQDRLLRFLKATGELIQIEVTPAGEDQTPEIYAGFVKGYGRGAPVQGKATGNLIFRINGIVSGDATDPAED